MDTPSGCGRFAPSPTGLLHQGSLMTALGSYLFARTLSHKWLIRVEDLDRPRVVPGAVDAILRTLETCGFEWDGPVLRQSSRGAAYEAALHRLLAQGAVYSCHCSRSRLNAEAEGVYPGTCRHNSTPGGLPPALRFRTDRGHEPVRFVDELQGVVEQQVERAVGDFVIRRRDGLFAYQLAVVVDDADQGVTFVARGADLLDNTPRQILLQQALGLPTPRYAHLPLLVEPDGSKLAKSRHAVPVDPAEAARHLWSALAQLRQDPPADLQRATPRELLGWAVAHWDPSPLSGVREIRLPA
jgi:glutamyl-Q tRNA(Asp) synthetase